jgi:DNA-binding winged helix-turn-helix (wHTH) protein
MPSTPTQTSIRFGTFDVDLQTQELRKQGVRLRLQAQSFLILKMLLEHPGKLVTREELRAALWPSDTFVDFDTGLNAAVKRLRETLGDSADSPHLIETLPRRGYRFIGPVDIGPRPTRQTRVRLRPPRISARVLPVKPFSGREFFATRLSWV